MLQPPIKCQLGAPTFSSQLSHLGLMVVSSITVIMVVTIMIQLLWLSRIRISENLQETANLVAYSSLAAISFNDKKEISEILKYVSDRDWLLEVSILSNDDQVLASIKSKTANEQDCELFYDLTSSEPVFGLCGATFSRQIFENGVVIGRVKIAVSLYPLLYEIIFASIATILVGFLIFIVALIFLRKYSAGLTKPLFELAKITEEVIRTNDVHLRAQIGGAREVRTLAQGFNHMLEHLAEMNEEILKISCTDSLSGLQNRRAFNSYISTALSKNNASCALIYLDLDGFKPINDNFSHDAGDEVLRQVANRLVNCIRKTDRVFRIGGDEFVLLLENSPTQVTIAQLAERMRAAISEPYTYQGLMLSRITASIGIAMFPSAAENSEELTRHADEAMYAAKQNGGNRIQFFDSKDSEGSDRKRQISIDINLALKQGQLRVEYQPQVRCCQAYTADHMESSIQIFGLEALIRWYHPKLGLINPDEFIGAAEKLGLISSIGEFVLETSCRNLLNWISINHKPLRLSVNLSGHQLRDREACDRLISIFRNSELPPGSIDLELTEGVLIHPCKEILRNMLNLRRSGFGIALDDFGTGYSSLGYLDSFPITMLKIDKIFLRRMASGARNDSVIRSIVALAKANNLELVGEGVETSEQQAALLKAGCNVSQGYFFSPAVNADVITQWLTTGEVPWGTHLGDNVLFDANR